MSRKYFVAIASVIARLPGISDTQRRTLAESMADICQTTNANFDRRVDS